MPEPLQPLGLPKGSVRSILILELVSAVVIIALAVTVSALLSVEGDFSTREAFLLVFGALTGMANLGIGYYFGTRSTEAAGGTDS